MIEIQDVRKSFGSLEVIRGASLGCVDEFDQAEACGEADD